LSQICPKILELGTRAIYIITRRDLVGVITALLQINQAPGTQCGSVAKNGWGRKKPSLDSSLGGNLEEALYESHLSANVAFPDSFNLSFPNHVHCLEPADRPPRRLETEEAESGIDSTFDESVVLLDYVIEVLGLA
jgi:hypothetical protein